MNYEFKTDDAFRFARDSGEKFWQKGDELVFQYCPFCKGGKSHDKQTFGIDLRTGTYNCLRGTCGAKGNMITLSQEFKWFDLGREFDEYYKPKMQYKKLMQPKKPIEPKPFAIEFLGKRGLSERTIKDFQIASKKDQPSILAFPFFDENGTLQFIKYRNTDPAVIAEHGKEFAESNCKPILFGMNLCDITDKTIVLTEGQIDSMSVYEAGIKNAVSVPMGKNNFYWIPYCWNFLENFDTMIVFGDFEKGHITLVDDMVRRFHGTVKAVQKEDYLDCKDANDILRKYGTVQIKKCIENAKPLPIDRLVNISNVKGVDPKDVKKLVTPFSKLNKMLHGGIPYGGVTIIASKRGSGKSIIASQIVSYALKNKIKTMIYSGELTNSLVKSWLDFQIAGPDGVVEYPNHFGGFDYGLPDHNKKAISDWYDGLCYVYSDSPTEQSEKENILKTIKEAITRYGVEVILIDNLMVAIDLDASEERNEFTHQSEFVKELARIGREYNVVIILVAHKRKGGSEDGDENDEVSGNSNITNLALVTMGYNKPTAEIIRKDQTITENNRILTIAKNRLFGETTSDGGIVMDYEPKSRRIYGEGDNPYEDYGWKQEPEKEKINEGFMIDGIY